MLVPGTIAGTATLAVFAMGSQPVTNAIKLLQACIYKPVNTGLFSTDLQPKVLSNSST